MKYEIKPSHTFKKELKQAQNEECHIQPDWLLIYQYDHTDLYLYLVRTGTHSDLF